MNFWKVLTACVPVVMFVLAAQTVYVEGNASHVQSVSLSGYPRLEGILFKAYPGALPEAIVGDFLAGEVDWIDGPYRIDLYNLVIDAGHKVLNHSSAELPSLIVINCRDYKGGGTENWPLNDTAFRLALSYIYGVDSKAEDIYNYTQAPWIETATNFLSPGCPYYNESIQLPNTDWTAAWSILQSAGYYVEDGYLKRDGKTVRDLEVWYGTTLFWEWGPGGGFVDAFNEFMVSIGAMNGPKMTIKAVTFYTLITELMTYHNFDFICIGLTGEGSDMLYDMLHSSSSWNFAGISDSRLDEFLEIWKDSMPCSPKAHWAASMVQKLLVEELLPYIPISYDYDICTVARDMRGELVGTVWTPELGYFNRLSYMMVHWINQTGGELKIALDDKWHNLNPFTEDTAYGWRILNTIIAPLLIEDPIHTCRHTCRRIPWIATKYEVSPWISLPELGIENGAMVTFWLRQDVHWHDLKPLTAYDCVNNMRLMREYHPGRYSTVWSKLVYEEADGPYKFIAYLTTMDDIYTWIYAAADAALLIPKHIADAIENMGGNPLEWDFTRPYEELGIGPPPPQYPFLTQLIGCGPYILHYANPANMTAHVVKFSEFFLNAP